jgi:hypothetical protein
VELWGYLVSTCAWDEVGLFGGGHVYFASLFRGEVHERLDLIMVDVLECYIALLKDAICNFVFSVESTRGIRMDPST